MGNTPKPGDEPVELLPYGEPRTLLQCPVGLFMSDTGELCLKTEYGNNEGRIDAFIVSSGEFFWGAAPQTITSQRAQMVQPLEVTPSARITADKDLENPVEGAHPTSPGLELVEPSDDAQRAAQRAGLAWGSCTGSEEDADAAAARIIEEYGDQRVASALRAQPVQEPVAMDSRLRIFLEILSAMGGQSDASDYHWNWINAFCGGHEGRDLDTFNRANDLGYIHVSHDSDTDQSMAYLTDKGRAYLAHPPLPTPPEPSA